MTLKWCELGDYQVAKVRISPRRWNTYDNSKKHQALF